MWAQAQTRALPAFDPPEILQADLAGLLLDTRLWGEADINAMAWLDPPPPGSIAQAGDLLRTLGALDAGGQVTLHGRALAAMPLPPRLAHMICCADTPEDRLTASLLAALLTERGLGGKDCDLRERLATLRRDKDPRARQARALATRWAALAVGASDPQAPSADPGLLLARAFPDRVAFRRDAANATYKLANGRAGSLDALDPLARAETLVVAELTGNASRGRILAALPADRAQLAEALASQITRQVEIGEGTSGGKLRIEEVARLGELEISRRPVANPPAAMFAQALLAQVRAQGIDALPWTASQRQLRHRATFLTQLSPDALPDLSDTALLASLPDWLEPCLNGKRRLADINADELAGALAGLLGWEGAKALDQLAPTHWQTPAGPRHAIDYDAPAGPTLRVRVQEMFGTTQHPAIAGGKLPLIVELLSPAHRPIQTTRDLPGFWRSSWPEVKAEMKGRYPKHFWPEDPAQAAPTTRTKARM